MGMFDDFPSIDRPPTKAPDYDTPYVPEFVPLTAITLNLEDELLEQYNRARRLLHAAQYDDSIPLNQKATAINSATTILGALIKSQAELYSLERVKLIEAVLVATLKKFPDLQAEFLPAYEEGLKNAE